MVARRIAQQDLADRRDQETPVPVRRDKHSQPCHALRPGTVPWQRIWHESVTESGQSVSVVRRFRFDRREEPLVAPPIPGNGAVRFLTRTLPPLSPPHFGRGKFFSKGT